MWNKHDFFAINKTWLLKTQFYSHLLNIFIGIIVFVSCHWLFLIPISVSVLITISSTLIVGVIVSILSMRHLHQPINAMKTEINDLHAKVNNTYNALASKKIAENVLIENIPVGIIQFDDNQKLVDCNLTAAHIINPENRDITRKTAIELLGKFRLGTDILDVSSWLAKTKKTGSEDTQTWSMVTIKSTDEVQAYDIIARFNNLSPSNYKYVFIIISKTEEYSIQSKQMDFISLAAHELRGPVTLIRGLVDLFRGDVAKSIDDEHNELLLRLAISSKQLANYIDTILNVSRTERDDFEIYPVEVDWPQLLNQATADLMIRAQALHRKMEIKINGNIPTVAVDSTAIQHVINNLLDNAIKYSKEGGSIVISTVQKGQSVETTVKDDGIGISGNLIENIFTKFYRSHKSKQSVSGTGLGLYLCQAIVKAHNGDIWVESKEGKGTTFGFTLPTFKSVENNENLSGNSTSGIVRGSHGWIKNHNLYRK